MHLLPPPPLLITFRCRNDGFSATNRLPPSPFSIERHDFFIFQGIEDARWWGMGHMYMQVRRPVSPFYRGAILRNSRGFCLPAEYRGLRSTRFTPPPHPSHHPGTCLFWHDIRPRLSCALARPIYPYNFARVKIKVSINGSAMSPAPAGAGRSIRPLPRVTKLCWCSGATFYDGRWDVNILWIRSIEELDIEMGLANTSVVLKFQS